MRANAIAQTTPTASQMPADSTAIQTMMASLATPPNSAHRGGHRPHWSDGTKGQAVGGPMTHS
jgi:hypothetical protein